MWLKFLIHGAFLWHSTTSTEILLLLFSNENMRNLLPCVLNWVNSVKAYRVNTEPSPLSGKV